MHDYCNFAFNVTVWIRLKKPVHLHLAFLFFKFIYCCTCFWIETKLLFTHTKLLFIHCSHTIHALYMRSITTLFRKKKSIKNGSHGTTHTFKNYFATMFSVFSNKRYSNRLYAWVWIALKRKVDVHLRFFCGSRALFTGPANTDFSKFFFKIRSHGTIHTFIIYFATMFSIFSNKRYSNRAYVSLGLELWIISLTMPQPRGTN